MKGISFIAAMLAIGMASGQEMARDFQCHRPNLQQVSMASPELPADTSQCVIEASRVASTMQLVDLRGRQDYVSYHAAGASNQQLSQLLIQRPKGIVVYDGGRLRQDAMLLCMRLQRYGLQDVRVVDGGIAAIARHRRAAQAEALSRLDDNEVAASLLSGSSRVHALAPAHSELLSSLGITSTARGQSIILAQQQPQIAARFNTGNGSSSVYWVGEASHLRQLLQNSQAQERKREEGPGYSPNCTAL